jgi:hypothetical protein
VHVHLDGGNLCDSAADCSQRCDRDGDGVRIGTNPNFIGNRYIQVVDNHLCTADTRQQVHKDTGLFAPSASNPLSDYWHVDVPYCTSDTWAGTRTRGRRRSAMPSTASRSSGT